MIHQLVVFLFLSAPAYLLADCAANTINGQPDLSSPLLVNPQTSLLDSYIHIYQPTLAISAKQSGREGRTTLTIKVDDRSVSQFMPVVSPQTQGMTFDVLRTWDALKVHLSSRLA